MSRSLATSLALASLLALAAVPAAAEVYDHLKCRNIVGAEKMSASVRVDGLDDRFDVRRCKVRRARALCSPAMRTGIAPKAEFDFVEGDDVAGDFVCYKTKCRKRPDANVATDAFGTREIRRLQSRTLCVPVEAPPAG